MRIVPDEVKRAGRKATTFRTDVRDRAQGDAAVDHAEKELGGFDIIVSTAGIADIGPVADVTSETVDRVLKINAEGVLWGIQATGKKFTDRRQKGKIINATSIAGPDGFELLGIYSATKFAVRGLTQAAAKECARQGIMGNAYCSGIVGTDRWVEIDKRMAEITGAKIGVTYDKFSRSYRPWRRADARRCCGNGFFLAGPDSDYITNAVW